MNSKIFAIDGREKFVDEIVEIYNKKSDAPDVLQRGEVKLEKFSDSELSVSFQETIRGLKTYLVCSTNSTEKLMYLLLAIDAAKKASAGEVIALLPYYGYSRQDRKEGMRGSFGASLVARLIQEAGADRVISMDLHSDQIPGFFKIPVDHISGKYIFPAVIRDLELDYLTLCSPDAGGVKRVDAIMKKLQKKSIAKGSGIEANMIMLSKRRDKPNSIESMELIGEVKDRNVIIIDDIVDTAGTLCKSAEIILEAGAASVRAICTHGVLSGYAHGSIHESSLEELIVSDSLEIPKEQLEDIENKIRVISIAKPIARLIRAINNKQSANVLEEQQS